MEDTKKVGKRKQRGGNRRRGGQGGKRINGRAIKGAKEGVGSKMKKEEKGGKQKARRSEGERGGKNKEKRGEGNKKEINEVSGGSNKWGRRENKEGALVG